MTTHTAPATEPATTLATGRWWLAAVGSVVVAIALASVFTPDLVTGSAQEHLPIAAITDWVWGAAALGYLAFVDRDRLAPAHAIAVAVLWFAVAAASIGAPELVTGSDPTRLPLVALIAPVVGTIVTGFLCLHALRETGR